MQHIVIATVDDIHPFLVVHREPVLIDHRLQVVQQVCALFQQFGVPQRYGTQLFWSEIRVAEHTFEAVHVDVRDVADHQDGLLHFTGVADKVLDLAQVVIEFLALLVDFHCFLKVFHHVRRRGGCLHDIPRGIDDTLGEIGGIGHDPLGFCCEADEKAAHTQHENFLFHDAFVLIGE